MGEHLYIDMMNRYNHKTRSHNEAKDNVLRRGMRRRITICSPVEMCGPLLDPGVVPDIYLVDGHVFKSELCSARDIDIRSDIQQLYTCSVEL